MDRQSTILLLGGNIGDVDHHLDQALELISSEIGEVVACSERLRTKAWGFECDAEFTNLAVEVLTTLEPEDLLNTTQSIEQRIGRDRAYEQAEREERGQKYASRVIDIDIILYGTVVYNSDRLKIPHPLMCEREFVLRPMQQIAAERVHPTLGLTIEQLLNRLK